MRQQVHVSGKTLSVLADEIHYSRSRISEHLAGKLPPAEFVTALVGATVREPRLHKARLAEAQSLLKAATQPSPAALPHAPSLAPERAQDPAELVDLYDRLTRSLEQQNELREAAGNSVKLVMMLLSMVNTLTHRITSLTDERDQLQIAQTDPEVLKKTQRQLARALEQESRAQQQLERAREKQRQAEELAARVQAQVDQLNDELDRLRTGTAKGGISSGHYAPADDPSQVVVTDPVGDDIEEAIARAAAVNDQDDQILRRITDDLDQDSPEDGIVCGVVQDNSTDNPWLDVDSAGNIPSSKDVMTWDDLVTFAASLPFESPKVVHETMSEIAVGQPMRPLRRFLDLLRENGHHTWSCQLLLAVGEMREHAMLPLVLGSLADEWADNVLILNGAGAKPAEHVQFAVELLNELGMRPEATYLMLAHGNRQSASGPTPEGSQFFPWIDRPGPPAKTAPSRPTDHGPQVSDPPTTRIRINIPGSRPIPPVVLRRTADTGGEQADLR
ncbi:hypothetical protein [Streptomyces sp. NPDC087294]|uniref:hypothetical protein n=1 Tax=Streptomyces sp. NPDC087294 TaxID=3365777 RepID=UPI0037F5EC17